VTLLEVLIVMAILLALAGLVFALAPGVRESGHRGVCASNMRQVYMGLSIYSADHDHGSAYPELHGLSYVCKPYNYDVNGKLQFLIANRDIHLCPSAPGSVRGKAFHTLYVMVYGCPSTKRGPGSALTGGDRNRLTNIEREKLYGPNFPVIYCSFHDEFHVAPHERHIDPKVATPFIMSIAANGTLKAGRDNRFLRTSFWNR
jgi:type II secretory pathway pseudopilin PulG